MRTLVPLIPLAVCLLSVHAGAQSPDSADAVLSPGDAVRINVWRKQDLSGEFFVAADGSVAHPFYADVKVGGVPFSIATDRVRRYVERFETSPRVLVEPLFQVMVVGEVRAPRLYTLRPEVTVAQAVGLAGGATERGQLERVQLLRSGRMHTIDLTDPNAALSQSPIRSGDQIVVPRRRDVFRDYIAPAGSITAALVTLVNIIINSR